MTEPKSQKDINQQIDGIKDTIKDKSSKLAAAVYLITNFLDNSDQIKWQLRDKSLQIRDSINSVVISSEIILSDIKEIILLMDIAVLDSRASAMNFSIVKQSYDGLQNEFQDYLAGGWYKNALIPPAPTSISIPKMAQLSQNHIALPKSKTKQPTDDNRREKILGFIKQHDWSSIKEIALFIPGVSSKTVQRELAELIRIGKLKKTGERRWSRYSLTA